MTNTDFDELPDLPNDLPDEGAHLDDFRVIDAVMDQVETDFLPVNDEGEVIEPDQGTGVMGMDAWEATWELAWNAPGMLIPKYAPLGITQEKKPASSAAAQAVYEIAAEHFPWMIEERGGVFGAVLAIGPFAAMQFGALREINADEKRKRVEAMNPPEPANTNTAPAPDFKSTRGEPGAHDWMDEEAAA